MPSAIIDEIFLPSTPLKVKLEDLSLDGKLLTNEQITQTINQIESIKNLSTKRLKKTSFAQRFKKNELNIPYDVIVFDEDYYAIYYGAKRDAHLGMGGFGYVKLVQNIKTGTWAVLKLTVADKEKNEYLILKKVELGLGYLERTVSKENSFIEHQKKQNMHGNSTWWSPHQANLLMELADGISLAHLTQNNYVLSANKWIEIILQVLKEYKKIKDKNVIHKDLKLENIFYSFSKNKATIIDFGGSRKKNFFLNLKKEEVIYSIGYTAPEIQKKGHFTEASDIYALGATFFYLLGLNDSTQSVIKDSTLYQKLYSYCFSCMANENKKKRPSTEDAIQFFETIQHSLSNILPKPLRTIGLFSVDEYVHYMNEAKMLEEKKNPPIEILSNTLQDEIKIIPPKQEGFYLTNFLIATFELFKSYFYPENTSASEETASKPMDEITTPTQPKEVKKRYDHSFISTLKLFDEVWLIDTSKRTKKEYTQLCRELEAQKIVVGQRCFISENKDLNMVIPAILDKLSKENSRKCNKYFCITAQSEMQLPPEICPITLQPDQDEFFYQKIIETYTSLEIQEEYQNIRTSLSEIANQHDSVKNIIEDFDRHFSAGILSLEYVKTSLIQLRKKLSVLEDNEFSLESPTHSRLSFFSKLLHQKSQANQIIEQLDSQIDDWVAYYQT